MFAWLWTSQRNTGYCESARQSCIVVDAEMIVELAVMEYSNV